MKTLTEGRFQLEVLDEEEDAKGKTSYISSGYSRYVSTHRAKVLKAAQYLGPWCSRCGRKDCRNKETCRVRQMVTLPKPTVRFQSNALDIGRMAP